MSLGTMNEKYWKNERSKMMKVGMEREHSRDRGGVSKRNKLGK